MVLKLTRPDGEAIYIPRSAIVSWSSPLIHKAGYSPAKAKVMLSSGYQFVLESCEEILAMMEKGEN